MHSDPASLDGSLKPGGPVHPRWIGEVAPADFGSLIWIVAGLFAVRLILAATMGLSFDETYDAVVARSLALGYFDHPPLTMWLIAAARTLTGSEADLVLRLPTLLLFAGTTWFLYLLTRLLLGSVAAALAALLLNLAPLFGFFAGMVAVTDGPVLFGLSGAAYFLAKALFSEEKSRPWLWFMVAGAFFGLALLAKYSAVLIVPGLLVFLISSPAYRHWLARPQPYLAGLVALLVFSPVILWNYQNGWASFVFQGSRAGLDASLHPLRFLQYLAGLALVFLPWIWAGMILALWDGLRGGPSAPRHWFLAWLAIVPVAFFASLWLVGRAGGAIHWAMPGYLFALPLFAASISASPRWRKFVNRALYPSLALLGFLCAALVSMSLTPGLAALRPSFRDYDPILADQTDWWDLRSALAERGMLDPNRYFVVSGRVLFCFKAELALKGSPPVACLASEPIGQALWTDAEALIGRDGVIITNWWSAPGGVEAVKAKFESVEELPPIWMTSFGFPRMRVDLLLGHRLKEPLPLADDANTAKSSDQRAGAI